MAQSILGWRGFKFVQIKGPSLFQGEIITQIAKIYWSYLKIFFSRTTGPISTKLGTEHHWVKGIQVCWNEGPHLSQRGDSWEIEKTHWKLFKIFFSRTTGTLMTKRYKSSYSIFLYEGPTPHQRGDNYKIVNMHWQFFKIVFYRTGQILKQSLLGWRGFIFL